MRKHLGIGLVLIVAILTGRGYFLAQATDISLTSSVSAIQAQEHPLCWDAATIKESMAEESFEEFIAGIGEGSGIYFAMRPNSDDAEVIGNGTYRVLTNTTVEVNVSVFFTSPPEQKLRYMMLVNEQPIPLTTSNDGDPYYLDVTAKSGEILELSHTLPALEDGINDVIFFMIPNVEQSPSPIGDRTIYAPRMTLISGEALTPSLAYTPFPEQGLISRNDRFISLDLTLGDDFKTWNYPEPYLPLKSGVPLVFNVLAGTNYVAQSPSTSSDQQEIPSRFALLPLLDYQQVSAIEGHSTRYIEVSGDTSYTRIPFALTPSLPVGQYDLLVVKINNPRIPMCVMRGENGVMFEPYINAVRVSVKIE